MRPGDAEINMVVRLSNHHRFGTYAGRPCRVIHVYDGGWVCDLLVLDEMSRQADTKCKGLLRCSVQSLTECPEEIADRDVPDYAHQSPPRGSGWRMPWAKTLK